MLVVVRLGGDDVSIESDDPQSLTLHDMTAQVREQRGGTASNRQLRFFINGRPLNPAVDFSPQKLEGRDRVYVHCFLGRILSPEELERELMPSLEPPAVSSARRTPQPQEESPQGFDRLRQMGFSDQDVQSLRQQFADLYGTNGEEEQHTLEDLWIDNGDMSPYNSRINDLVCIMMGVFGGIWAVLLVRIYTFTRRQYATILFGIAINVVFSVFQLLA